MINKKITTTFFILCMIILIACSFKSKPQKVSPYFKDYPKAQKLKTVPIKLQKDSLYLGTWFRANVYGQAVIAEIIYIKDSAINEIFYDFKADTIFKVTHVVRKSNETILKTIKGNCMFTFPQSENTNGFYFNAISAYDSSLIGYYNGKVEAIERKIDYPMQAVELCKSYLAYNRANDTNTLARWGHSGPVVLRLYKDGSQYKLMYYGDDYTPEEQVVELFPHPLGTKIVSKTKDVVTVYMPQMYYAFSKDTQYFYQIESDTIHDFSKQNPINMRILNKNYLYNTPIDTVLFGKGFKWK